MVTVVSAPDVEMAVTTALAGILVPVTAMPTFTYPSVTVTVTVA